MKPARARDFVALTRPRLLPSALADPVCGSVFAGGLAAAQPSSFLRTLVCSLLVYAGGMVLNDVADRRIDARERPERPIPSGRVAAPAAALFGLCLVAGGLGAAPAELGLWPVLLAGLVLAYDFVLRRARASARALAAPCLGLCRALNLGLGYLAAGGDPRDAPPGFVLLAGGYALYTALVAWHGEAEAARDRRALCTWIAALVVPCGVLAALERPLLGLAAWSPMLFELRPSGSTRAHTGLLLRGLPRFTFGAALAEGAWLEAALLALPAWILPALLGRLRSPAVWT